MSGYVKLFSDIVDSSIWNEDPVTFKVWIALLALADPQGHVRGSIPWLAKKSLVTIDQCTLALEKFTKPDPESRTKDYDGRRIETLEDGWLVLNYLLFRDRLSNNEKASASRDRVRKHRERYIALRNANRVTGLASASVYESVPKEIGGVGGRGKPTLDEVKLLGAKVGLTGEACAHFYDHYESNGWKVGRNPMRSVPHALANWKRNQQTYGPKSTQQSRINQRNVGTYETTTDIASAIAKRSVSGQMAAAENRSQPPLKGLGNGV